MKIKKIILIILCILLIVISYYVHNYKIYSDNIALLTKYSAYDDEQYPRGNMLVSRDDLEGMNDQITEILMKYDVEELNISQESVLELYNLDKYHELENLEITCPLNDVKENEVEIPTDISNLKIQNCSEIASMGFVSNFNNLKSLEISPDYVNDGKGRINKIEGLENLIELEELDLSHQNINKIEGLDNQKKLKELQLQSNNISKIDGLENLDNLKKLYLFNNPIDTLENIEKMDSIEEIYIDVEDLKYITEESYDYILDNNIRIFKNNYEYQRFEEISIKELDVKII